MPNLAIIVPVLNEARNAEKLAERLGKLGDFEIIIVDGGSDDETVKILSRNRAYSMLSGPKGRAAQMNFGARHAHADVLLFLHADTALSDLHIKAALRAISQGADFGCFTLQIDSQNPLLLLAGRIISLRSRLLPSATGDQAIFFRRAFFERLGGYREIALCEDIDLMGRAKKNGRFVCVENAVRTSARRWEQRGILRTILLMWMLRLGCHLGCDPATLKRLYQDVR